MDKIAENKLLCEKMPYLIPRNVWTDKIVKDYDYSYLIDDGCLPKGWHNLFMQMCQDIRQPLIDTNYLDKFRFSQIKEKYGSLRAYTFGAPKAVADMINKYEHVSQFICSECGQPAVYQTQGYILPYCKTCYENKATQERAEKIEFNPSLTFTFWSKDRGTYTESYNCQNIWNQLFKNSRI